MAEIVKLTALNALPQGVVARAPGCVIEALPIPRMTCLMPPKGGQAALSAALQAAHGLALPGAGRMTRGGQARCLWFGHAHWLLLGAVPDPALAQVASLTDQSDGWCMARLSGPDARDVLARLTPLDLRDSAFAEGAVARSLLGHMSCGLIRTGSDSYVVMAFRSMAGTLLHDLRGALTDVANRAVVSLPG